MKAKTILLFFISGIFYLSCSKDEAKIPEPKYNNLAIEKTSITLKEGEQTTLSITSGSGSYVVTSSDMSKVKGNVQNTILVVTAIHSGNITLTVKDTKTKQSATITVTVIKTEKEDKSSIYIELTTTKAVGEKIQFKINAEEKDKENIWIDLNNNGKKDSGEKVNKFDNNAYGNEEDLTSYVLGSQTIRIYGKVTLFSCGRFISKGEWIRKRDIIHLDVSNNPMLKILNCTENINLKNLDISKNTNLEYLDCSNCNLTDLDVSKNIELKNLTCGENKFTEINLSNNMNLEVFHCSQSLLKILNISKNKKLWYLHFSGSTIESLDLSQNTELVRLECYWNNQLSKLDVSNNIKLQYLYCYENTLTDIDISNNINIASFDCSYNQLTNLDVSKNTNLDYFYCYGNPLSCIKVNENQLNNIPNNWSKDDAVTYSIDCNGDTSPTQSYIEFTTKKSIGASINLMMYSEDETKDIWIDLNNNGIKDDGETAINNYEEFVSYTLGSQTVRIYGELVTFVSGFDKNKKYGAQITSIDVSHCKQLKGLICDGNELTNLDVSQNTELTILSCGYNNLTSIDISKNTKLEQLYCYANQLRSLDVTALSELKLLVCTENLLEELNISQNTLLEELDCTKNPNLACIKVNDDQLANIPYDWKKDTGANYSNNCNGESDTKLKIGQYYQGGIIASLSSDGKHGFVVSDIDEKMNWESASEYCENLVYKGYDDWKLPLPNQLYKMKKLYDKGLCNFKTGTSIYVNYWSSQIVKEVYSGTCRKTITYYDFDEDEFGEISNCYHLRCRPIREF